MQVPRSFVALSFSAFIIAGSAHAEWSHIDFSAGGGFSEPVGQAGSLVNGAHYSASKAGILALTKVVARELAPHGVTVNAVAPAAIDGPVMTTLPAGQVEALARSVPVGRLGTPEEVAALVAFLASDEAAFITGATFDVNGGLLMR